MTRLQAPALPRRLQAALDRVQPSLFPPDPGSVRLVGAARATLGALLTLVGGVALDQVVPMPFTARVLGFSIALFLGATVRDATPAGQAVTILLAPIPVFATICLVALALPIPYAPDLLTLAAVFVAICAASCGPRWAALGALSLTGLLVALLSRVTPAELPSRLVVLLLAAAAAALARFVILPDRPVTQLRRLRSAIRHGMDGVLAAIEAAVRQGAWPAAERRAARRCVARLNEAVMLAQPLLAPAPALHLLECDLMVERVARVALLDLGTPAQRPELLARLAALRHAVLTDAPVPAPGPQTGQLAGVLAALALLLDRPAVDSLAAPFTPRAPIGATGSAAPPWATLEVRPAVQATLATLLAIVGGSLISPDHWFWAVFSAFVLFQGTRSRGESIAKAVEMMLGTLAGVLAGLLLASLLSGHREASLAAIVGGMFLAIFASTAAYGVMVFWITVVLGVLFGMLGAFPRSVLLLRLEETVVGGACGIAVAWLVLARPTPNLVRSCAAAFLRALAPVVQQAARPLLDQPAEDTLPGMVVGLERRFQALQAAAQPRLPGVRLLGAERTRRMLLLLAACDEWARELVRTSLHLEPRHDAALAAIATQATRRIAGSIADLAAALEGHAAAAAAMAEPAATAAVPEGEDAAIHATKLLLRLDGALLHLRQRVTT